MPIQWKLHPELWSLGINSWCYQHTFPQCASETNVRRALENVFAEITNASGGKVRFQYAGIPTGDPDLDQDGFLYIRPDETCMSPNAYAYASVSGGPTNSGVLGLCHAGVVSENYTPWLDQGGGYLSFHYVALHETMHILGMDHGTACGSPNAAVISPNNHPSQHLTGTDILFLNDKYPGRVTASNVRYSDDDGLSWTVTNTAPPSGASNQASRFAATNNSRGGSVYLAWIERTSGADRRLAVSKYSPGWAAVLGTESTTTARYHPGIANKTDSDVRVAYGTAYEDTTGLYHIGTRASTDGGTSWASTVTLTSNKTHIPGVTGTWTETTGIQGGYVWAWRIIGYGAGNGRIAYKIGANAIVTDFSLQSSDTPSIACGPAGVANGYNCLLAFTSVDGWGPIVKWTQCSTTSGTLDCLAVKSLGAYAVGSPSVSYAGEGAGSPWLISISQGGRTTYAWRKGINHSSDFADQRSFVSGDQAIVPAAATRIISHTTFPFTTSRRYVFVPSFLN
jgi:hypothetical protein